MWPKDKMPEPAGGKRLSEYGCKIGYAESLLKEVRRIETPDDIRPGTRKGKIDHKPVWMVNIKMPKRLMKNVDRGYHNLDKNKVQDILSSTPQQMEPADQQAPQEAADEQPTE
jgi:hypothetical protein